MTAPVILPLVPADEFPHEPVGSSRAPWKDTWWFVARDPEHDVVVETHLTLSPGAPATGRVASLVRWSTREATAVHQGPALDEPGRLGIAEASVEVVDGAWNRDKRLVVRGSLPEASFELELRGRYDAVDATALAPGFLPVDDSSGGAMRNAQHGMTFEGMIRFGDDVLPVAGTAFRDRSWGWRESNELLRHGWYAFLGHAADCTFSIVGFYRGDARDGAGGRSCGWVADADGVSACTEVGVVVDGGGRPAAVRLRSGRGRALDLEVVRHEADTFLSFHDAVGSENQWLVAMRNHHVRLRSAEGDLSWGYANLGDPVRSHPLEGMTVFP